jgi:uncharacterized protein (DUF927 family)
LVVICEGEKATDAATRIFPDSVAVTSSCGSKAAAKADWGPLAGREIIIWPDADEQGMDYAREVASILLKLNCAVSTIDASALATADPNGGDREHPKKGWDAADAETEWTDHDALRKRAMKFARKGDTDPAYISWGDFTMDSHGLTVEIAKGRNADRTVETVRIAAPFEILGRSRDPRGSGWGKWLAWRDEDRRVHSRHVADAALHSDPAALCAGLADGGLWIDRGHQRVFATYLAGAQSNARVALVHRTGWHEIGGESFFVLPNEIIGPKASERIVLDEMVIGSYEARGSFEDWQAGVGKLSSGHVIAILAISAALAGPLLHLAEQEGGGIHFFGASSLGKTTVLKAAASVWGRGASPGYLRAWRATANGLEGAAAAASDTCLILDELGMVEAREAAPALYGLANGSGKARAARDGSLREPKGWRVLFLSSGEVPTETKLTEARGHKARAGQLVRLLDIPADRGTGFGAFDHADGYADAGALAKAIKVAAVSAFGTAGTEFVRRVISEGITGIDLRGMIAEFVLSTVGSKADGQIDRAAQRLGLVGTAGELATALGITMWRPGEARDAAEWALGRWIEGRGGTEPAEVREAVEQVRLFIEQHGESRFARLDDSESRPVANRAGWRKGAGAEREWLIPSTTWRADICHGLDPKLVARVLAERGMLERASDGLQPVRKIEGVNTRVYIVKASIFDGGRNET